MSMNDPIADMLTRVRNANSALHEVVLIPASKIKIGIAQILKDNGFIQNFEIVKDPHATIKITLKYGADRERVILGIERISKCGRRVYVDKDSVYKVQGGFGISILTTSKGIITDRQARQNHIGGELICKVW